jgi:predicted nucleic acid-binding protein
VARAEVPDTSVFIHVIRQPRAWPAFQRFLASGNIWLSSVVAAELYAGTRAADDALKVNRIVATMQRFDRLVTPTHEEWGRAGRLIGRRTRLQGALRPRDHLADVLILLSAARLHGTVITSNMRHFEDWARLASAAGLDVEVTRFQP